MKRMCNEFQFVISSYTFDGTYLKFSILVISLKSTLSLSFFSLSLSLFLSLSFFSLSLSLSLSLSPFFEPVIFDDLT